MSQLLDVCMVWGKSESILRRVLSKVMVIIPIGYGKLLEIWSKNSELPADWDEKMEREIYERIIVKAQWSSITKG